MGAKLYLGRAFDPGSRALGDRFEVDADDLTTHGLIVGMTGSGKTGMSTVLIEECIKAGIPVIAIDPKGDLVNLALCFDHLEPARFTAWVDDVSARRDGQSREEAGLAAAAAWSRGLAEWGISAGDVTGYRAGHDLRILTPGSTAGIPLSLVDRLDPPPAETLDDPEEFRDQVDAVVTALLGLVDIEADPVRSREYILLHAIIGEAWKAGRALTLEGLIGAVARPTFDRLGALPLDTVYPERERQDLMLALNGILASPQLEAWRQGEPVDIDRWLQAPDGRPRLTIIYTAHLADRERMSVTALVLNRLRSWMRRQAGTGELRCLVYMDEIFGYFPPTANPPTKKPLLTLLKQARAFGVGVLLATQNPVDLDYKGLSNMGFWAIGRLQTPQDQARVREGVQGALAGSDIGLDFDRLMAGVQKRVFLVHNIHRGAPSLVHTRWAMSYLRGPLTRDEVGRIAAERGMTLESPQAVASAQGARPAGVQAPDAPAHAPAPAVAPTVPGVGARYWRRYGGNLASPCLLARAAVRYRVGSALTEETTRDLLFPLSGAGSVVEALEGDPFPGDDLDLADSPPTGLTFGDLPASLLGPGGSKEIERALRSRLDDRLAVTLFYDPVSKEVSRPGESAGLLALRIRGTPEHSRKRATLEQRLQAKRMQLDARRSERKSRRFEKWVSLATAALSNVSIFTGKKRTVSGAGSVLTKNRMENTAEARVEKLEAEIRQLETEMEDMATVDPARFEERLVKPASTNVALIRYEIVWAF
ncbi:MAG: DUF853 family protein [Dehalococcoidia bacterium]|nr:DUF853 family protein [Dehalococcoidia bacterium]